MTVAPPGPAPHNPAHGLYRQVLIAMAAGALLGWLSPAWGAAMQPFAAGFVKLVSLMIGPIVFTTVLGGIAHVGDARKAGRVGLRAIFYFEVVTTLALFLGLAMIHLVKPGAGMSYAPTAHDAEVMAEYAKRAHAHGDGAVDMILNVIPESVVDAFSLGNTMQVLFLAILTGLALGRMGERARPIVDGLALAQKAFFAAFEIIMRLAPLGAFGGMAVAVGKFGVGALGHLGLLMACFYATAALFILVVLGAVSRAAGFSVVRLIRYLGDEILLVLGTSSSEAALTSLMSKLERLGCAPSVVRLVVPTGYSFNLDGTSIYLTMAALFVAQATGAALTWEREAFLLGVLLLTSKGAAGVTGAGFVTLAATLSATGDIPVAGLALLLGIDRFMSEARAITNLIGNAVATVVIARWEGALDRERMTQVLGGSPVEAVAVEEAPA